MKEKTIKRKKKTEVKLKKENGKKGIETTMSLTEAHDLNRVKRYILNYPCASK